MLVPVPPGPVTLQWDWVPTRAVDGTVAVICVFESTVNAAVTRPSRTVVAPAKLFPRIFTWIPRLPDVGVKLEIVGLPVAAVTVNEVLLVPVPLGVVTAIGPVLAPVGTRAVTLVSELNVTFVDAVPLKVTAVTPVKPVPVMETFAPTGPLVGVNDVTVGALPPPPLVTVKVEALAPVPPGVVTAIGPVCAPVGTVAWSSVAESTWKVVAATPPNVTAVAPVKALPVTSTFVPTGPLVGVNDETTGGLPPPLVQLGNLKEPMRVCQFQLPSEVRYSPTYQNVQSSEGSMLMLV
jgi:hypothetical protein